MNLSAKRSAHSNAQEATKVLLISVSENAVAINNREECMGLVHACGAQVVDIVEINIRHIDARLYIGVGKVQYIRQQVVALDIELVVFNADLTPSQERNIEKYLQCRVIDRTRLILDIFALRAYSHEGKLQVELAQLAYLSTRLVRGWTHLERQKGGIGLRGPGETQLESDRRMLSVRVNRLKKQLIQVHKRRKLGRRARNAKIIALAGYTNAGKSSVFNALCSDSKYVADQLFASLDTTLRQLVLPGAKQAVLVDTVGFVENLPHQLIDAFSSTLTEVVEADVVLHICDASDHRVFEKMKAVDHVLQEIGAGQIDSLIVWNKCDALSNDQVANLPRFIHDEKGRHPCVAISAITGQGLDVLCQHLATMLSKSRINGWFVLQTDKCSCNRAYLYKIGAIQKEMYSKHGEVMVHLDIDADILSSLSGIQKIQSACETSQATTVVTC